MYRGRSVALAIPCYNEELAVGIVVDEFAGIFPDADIFVFDNNFATLL